MDVGGTQLTEQGRNSGAVPLGVVGINQILMIFAELQMIFGQLRWQFREGGLQVQHEFFFSEVPHQLFFILDEYDFTVIDDTNPISQLLGLFNVVGR